MNRNHIIVLVVLVVGFFAFQAAGQEYQRIQKRIETTQAKVDLVADETAAAIADIRRAIAAIVDRFSESTESEKQFQESVTVEVEKLREQIDKKPTKKTIPKIVMHSGYSCGICNEWISNSLPSWQLQGWQVEVVKEIESTRSWPWFEVCLANGRRFEVNGPLTLESYERIAKGLE